MTATGFAIPAQADLEAVVGADFEAEIVFYQDVEQTILFGLSGNTISMQIGSLFTLVSGTGLTIDAGGTVTARLTAAQTGTITPNPPGPKIHYWLKFVNGGTISYPLQGGMSFVSP